MDKPRILVIDDELGIREGCRRFLEPSGFIVDTAETGDEGLHLIHSNLYDMVLTDVMMPGISGIDLISQIRQVDEDTISIIITGYATVEMAVRAIKEGAYDFLTKPFTTDDLLLVVNQGMEKRRLSLETKRLKNIEKEAEYLTREKFRLEELDKAKLAFIRLVSHELKAPIAAILNYLDLIQEGYIPPEKQSEYLERTRQRAREQLQLIADLLEFGRLKEIKSPGNLALINLGDILQEVITIMKDQAIQKQIKIELDIPHEIPAILADEAQIKSVWINLISNAIKFSPSKGNVKICLQKYPDHILAKVSDGGIGIPPEAKDKIFTEFYRAKNAKLQKIPGTGLGLAIVKQIIDRLGGKIWFDSPPGQGTIFYFSLPIPIS